MNRSTIAVAFGTRPEAIKLAPLVLALRSKPWCDVKVVVTGQHREMLDQVLSLFGIEPDVDLDMHRAGQTLVDITTSALSGLAEHLHTNHTDLVVVQGDTTSTMASALAAFYAGVPVVHVEAGLRTGTPTSPFPEELNRRLTTVMSSLHLAATEGARQNLLAEGVDPSSVVVTGNTVIDALLDTVGRENTRCDDALETLFAAGRRVIAVTAHRRESWGESMVSIGRALGTIASEFSDVEIVFPIHRNPIVREAIAPGVEGHRNVHIIEPLPYGQFCRLLARSHLVLTDSGGVQEEAPALGKPVLVMRESTERPEAIEAGSAILVGTSETIIVDSVSKLLTSDQAYAAMANAVNPYGDGHACPRSVHAIERLLGYRTDPPSEFVWKS